MGQNSLMNCKKCGTLFIKTARDICDSCYKLEMDLAEKVKNFLYSCEKQDKQKATMDEILKATKISKKEFEKLFEKGRLFSVMSKITVKCRFCGIEFECDQKPSFLCQKCLIKLSKKGEHVKVNHSTEEAKRREKAMRQSVAKGKKTRYGFIQNFDI